VGRANSVAFSPDGLQVLSGGNEGLKLWDVASGACLRSFDANSVRSVAFSPDGSLILSGAGICIGLWKAATGELDKVIAQGYHTTSGRYGTACWQPESGKVLSMSGDAWRWLHRVSPGQYWPQPVLQADA
jgi:WD40 repeat protein